MERALRSTERRSLSKTLARSVSALPCNLYAAMTAPIGRRADADLMTASARSSQ
jgi:hypothetical protein